MLGRTEVVRGREGSGLGLDADPFILFIDSRELFIDRV